jgi:hypothetical protein
MRNIRLAMVIMATIILMPLLAYAETDNISENEHYLKMQCNFPFNVEGIVSEGKLVLHDKLSGEIISLNNQKITVIASVDGIQREKTGYVATVTNYYENNSKMIVEMCIDCDHSSFEVQARIENDGSVSLVHFTGVTYFIKDLGDKEDQINKASCSMNSIKNPRIISIKPLVGEWIAGSDFGPIVKLRGSVTGDIILAEITAISIDEGGNVKVRIKPGNEFWTDLIGNKLVFNENLFYEIIN